jgi:hypothetical protein
MMKFIEEYDEVSGTTFIIPEFEIEIEDATDLQGYVDSNRDLVTKAIAAAADLMVEFELDEIPCFVIKNINTIFKLNRAEAVYSVDQCIQYFLEIEDYEKCARLTNVKSRL